MPEPDEPHAIKSDPGPGLMETALLHDLTRWREQLARSIARNNPGLRSREIAVAVNRILFPLLFITAAEDRHLLPAGTLATLRDTGDEREILARIGRLADGMYEDIPPETFGSPGQPEPPDIGQGIFRAVLTGFASQVRAYDLGRMPALSIGQVLARYLTRTVRRSAAHQAEIGDTHDTVLSGSTYIPPRIIVSTAADHALDAIRKNRSKREILPVRVLDPACGSGTCLVAAYRNLLGNGGGSGLTLEERREVLAGSIHGVDISPHAVAATRMLLVLELLENASPCGENGDFEEFLALVLPPLHDLRQNIVCGNALIGPEIAHDESWNFCPPHKRQDLNLFAWDDHFTEVRAAGGFDLVFCNPPEGPVDAHEWIQQHFQRRYSMYHRSADRSAYFIERALSLLRPGGTLAFVMQSRWLRGSAGSPLRDLLKTRRIEEIAEYPGTGLCSIRVRNGKPSGTFMVVRAEIADTPDGAGRITVLEQFPASPAAAGAVGWNFRDTRNDAILEKMQERGTPVGEFCMGESGAGSVFKPDDRLLISRRQRDRLVKKDRRMNGYLRPFVSGRDIVRYHAKRSGNYLLLVPGSSEADAAVKPGREQAAKQNPALARLLDSLNPDHGISAGGRAPWYETMCREAFLSRDHPKILFPARGIVPVFMADNGRSLIDSDTGFIVTGNLLLLAVLNSRLARFWFMHRHQDDDRRSRDMQAAVAGFFIHVPDPDNEEEAGRQNRIETLARRMLAYHDQLVRVTDDLARENFRKKIERADRQIDALVYELYGLTPEEILVVEEATR